MGCCNELTAPLATKNPDPSKHVSYAKGMVLGVDDFTQEFAYLSGRDEWLARDLIGYGTTAGLAVKVEDDGKNGPRVRVTAGSAVTQRGTLTCVPTDQCASLNAWLAKPENAKKIRAAVTSPPSTSPPLTSPPSDMVALYVSLCYRDCLTDRVPIPGEPCRSEDDLMAASRIADDFLLRIDTDPPPAPPQVWEEAALRDFVQWLNEIRCDDLSSPPSSSEEDLLQALRDAAAPWFVKLKSDAASQPGSPAVVAPPPLSDYMFGTPPESLRIHPDQRCDLLRAAFRLWVTELRPAWMARCCACAGIDQPADDCVLLAELQVPVIGNPGTNGGVVWQVNGDYKNVQVDEGQRPFLIHQRLLQEWLLCGSCCAPPGIGAGPFASPPGATPPAPQAQLAFDTASADITLDDRVECLVCLKAIDVTLPGAAAKRGRVYTVKNAATTASNLRPAAGDKINNAGMLVISKGKSATVISDGSSNWYVIATA